MAGNLNSDKESSYCSININEYNKSISRIDSLLFNKWSELFKKNIYNEDMSINIDEKNKLYLKTINDEVSTSIKELTVLLKGNKQSANIWGKWYFDVENIIEYINNIYLNDRYIFSNSDSFKSSDYYFHKQSSLLVYIYSAFDKLTNLTIQAKQIIMNEEHNSYENKIIKFANNFLNPAIVMVEEKYKIKFNEFVNNLLHCNVYLKIKSIRNWMAHHNTKLDIKYNFGLLLSLLIFCLLRICVEIKLSFKVYYLKFL